MKSEEFERQEKIFRKGKALMKWGLLIWLSLGLFVLVSHYLYPEVGWFGISPYFKKHKWATFWFWIGITIACRPFSIGFLLLYKQFKEFIKNSKIQEGAAALRSASRGRMAVYPKFGVFLNSASLKEFERRYVSFYASKRRQCIKFKHMDSQKAKINDRMKKIESKAELLERQFTEASLSIESEKELAKFERHFREAKTWEACQSVIAELTAISKQREVKEDRQNTKINQLIRSLLSDASNHGMCAEASTLVNAANSSPYAKQKIECLKKAISAQRKFNQRTEVEMAKAAQES